MSAEKHPSIISLSERKSLKDAVRQALSEMRYEGDKQFHDKVEDALDELDKADTAVAIIDWDIGFHKVFAFMEAAKLRPNREYWAIYLIAGEQSDKIVAAGAEFGAAKVFTGALTATKLKIAFDESLKDLSAAQPMRNSLKQIHEARANDEWDRATSLLEDLLRTNPANKRILFELGESYLQTKQFEKTKNLLESSAQENAPDTRILHVYAKALIKLGKTQEAADCLKKADLINPFNTKRLVDLGNALLSLDELTEAAGAFARAVDMDPDCIEALQGQGTVKLMDGDVNEALKLLKNKVTGRELASIFNTAAVLSMHAQRFDEGISLYESAEKVLSKSPSILARIFYNKGLGLYRFKKLEEAAICFDKSHQLDPSFANSKHNLKAVQAEIKNPKKSTDLAEGMPTPASLVTEMEESKELSKNAQDELFDLDERI